MTGEEWALAAGVFCSGLASGLLGMLVAIMHPMLTAMDGRGFQSFMKGFLRYADHSWGKVFNYLWSIGMFIFPLVALILLWDDAGSISFVLTAIGLVVVVLGIYVVANVWKEPHYKVMLGWDPDALPADWEAGRRKYFSINWIQCATTWSAFILYLAALIQLD
jgi:hypothetical protein